MPVIRRIAAAHMAAKQSQKKMPVKEKQGVNPRMLVSQKMPASRKINANLQTGQSLGDQAEKIISIGDLSDRIILLKEYQDNFKNIFLPPDKLEYKNEGLTEIKNILLYRTTNIDLDVEEYNQLYQSFNPITNPDVFVRSYSDNESLLESSDIPVLSYDVLENIEPNINYYYTCIVQDVHENPSNPSIIYRVRLLLDKGLLIPEIELVKPIGSNKQIYIKRYWTKI